MLCPLVGSVFPLEVILFIEKVFCSLDIRRANFSVVEQIVICKQCYFKNAKLMSVLKFENSFFNKTNKFCKSVISAQDL